MRLRWVLSVCASLLSLSALLAGGCSSIYARGTPFYSGPAVSQGKLSDAERVNVWPLAYYRDPDLSVLWPVFEKTPDHLAVRPLWSVYRLDEQRREYNVLWPVSQFDFSGDDHRIFPFFWGGTSGDRYFVLFPEVWWFQKDAAGVFPAFWWKNGFTVFPLAWYQKDRWCHFFPLWLHEKGDTSLLWPTVNWKDDSQSSGWRAWPLFGDYRAKGRDYRYSFALWPLGHYRRDGGERWLVGAPLYCDYRNGEDYWRLLLPAYYGRREGGNSLHVAPLWAAGRTGQNSWSTLVPLYFHSGDQSANRSLFVSPLWASGRDGGASWQLLVPLLYRGADPAQKRQLLVTPLWAAGRSAESSWDMLIPFYHRSSDQAQKTSHLITPLVGRIERDGRARWLVIPAFSSVAWGPGERDIWALGPVFHARWGGDDGQSHLFPLYYHHRDGDGRLFLSPLYSAGGDGRGSGWNLLTPLWYRRLDAAGPDSLTVTPLFAHRSAPGRTWTAVLPALSLYGREGQERDLWTLGPLVHARWGGRLQNHVLPIYYYDREEKLFLSPLFSRGGGEGGFWNALILGAHLSREPGGRRTLWVAPPLTAFGWGPQYSRASVYPLFSSERNGDWRSTWVFPWIIDERSAVRGESSFFPLWGYERRKDERGRHSDVRVLGWLYEHHRANIGSTDPKGEGEAVRTRVLWKVVDYQRARSDKSLDCFPFISWDSRENGKRRFAFAWRLFRWERSADGGRKLDVLFIPLRRKAGEAKAEPAAAPAPAAVGGGEHCRVRQVGPVCQV